MASPARGGRLLSAPEHFLDAHQIAAVQAGRRGFLRGAFAAAAAAGPVSAQGEAGDADILNLPPHSKGLGQPVAARGYGLPSEFEKNLQRRESPGLTRVGQSSVSFCPLQGLFGIVTPSGLHFERHHQGWWDLDPRAHRLMLNGSDERMLKRAMVFTVDELMRLPSVSRFHFIECGANTAMEWGNVAVPTVQYTHGMLSCSEFTGVPLITLLEMAGADLPRGRFVLAEGGDGSGMTRTIPMDLVRSGEVLVAYGQDGEMLRRIELGDAPYGTKDETLHYVDLMPDGRHRQYSSIQEVKSVITTPSGGQVLLQRGFHAISGLAWSGRGRMARVDVSVDGGRNWRAARLQTPVMSKCLTRFSADWVWKGEPALLMSRAIDGTGQVQPSYPQLRAARGRRSIYHNNAMQTWWVQQSGEVSNVQLS